jgi:hypothetical protein
LLGPVPWDDFEVFRCVASLVGRLGRRAGKQAGRQADRQPDRQAGRQMYRMIEYRKADVCTNIHVQTYKYKQKDIQTGRHAGGQTDRYRETDSQTATRKAVRQTDTKTERQTDRWMDS